MLVFEGFVDFRFFGFGGVVGGGGGVGVGGRGGDEAARLQEVGGDPPFVLGRVVLFGVGADLQLVWLVTFELKI